MDTPPGILNQLAAEIHADNVKAGWWSDLATGESTLETRNVGELLCLVHSEISEALEGMQTGAPDDKLKHRLMYEVELADALIRLFDIAGSRSMDMDRALLMSWMDGPFLPRSLTEAQIFAASAVQYATNTHGLLLIHQRISMAMEGHRKGNAVRFETELATTILLILALAGRRGFNMEAAIAEKRAFNASRADHKIENRLKADGKKY